MAESERPLSAERVADALRSMNGWSAVDGTITKSFETDGWRTSMLVANAVGFLCEAADHHADLLVAWPRVRVTLSTHSAGGVTGKDLELARLIDAHLTWRPPSGSSLTGPATPIVR